MIGQCLAEQEKELITSKKKKSLLLFSPLHICQGLRPDFCTQLTLLNFSFAGRPRPSLVTIRGGMISGVEQTQRLILVLCTSPLIPYGSKNHHKFSEELDFKFIDHWFWLMEISDPL